MKKPVGRQLGRDDWLLATLSALQYKGVEGIKIVGLAKELGVTSGSFYWHFKDLNDLLTSALDFWEAELTDKIMVQAREFDGSAEDRILNLMTEVVRNDAAAPDHAISVWARRDTTANKVYQRTLEKRFGFASWMFEQVGFEQAEAALRGRLLVAYLMGESSTNLKTHKTWEKVLKQQLQILTATAQED
ncbi:MAG: TetR/AcrR family transcriptional regulator [Roseibium sp.]